MKNYIESGENLTLTMPAAVSSGDGVQIGNIFGVAAATYAISDEGVLHTKGVFSLAKVSAQAWAVGDPIYWDATAENATNVAAAAHLLIGVAVAIAANPSSTGSVMLGRGVPEAGAPVQGSVAVDGGVLAIPVTHRYVAKTTGGAEALSLANGTPGQVITIQLVDDSGTGTLTPATATGFVSVALDDAGDWVTLEYLDDTSGWFLVAAGGAAAQPAVTLS